MLRERELNKPPRAFREIFRVLRQLDNAQSGEVDIEPEQDENDDE